MFWSIMTLVDNRDLKRAHLPMLWDHTEPFDAGVLQGYIGIESTSYGAMDDPLLLLGE